MNFQSYWKGIHRKRKHQGHIPPLRHRNTTAVFVLAGHRNPWVPNPRDRCISHRHIRVVWHLVNPRRNNNLRNNDHCNPQSLNWYGHQNVRLGRAPVPLTQWCNTTLWGKVPHTLPTCQGCFRTNPRDTSAALRKDHTTNRGCRWFDCCVARVVHLSCGNPPTLARARVILPGNTNGCPRRHCLAAGMCKERTCKKKERAKKQRNADGLVKIKTTTHQETKEKKKDILTLFTQ